MTEVNYFDKFFSSYNNELKSKVQRLDDLIGRDHWLSVGDYKESMLRDLLKNVIPKKFEVSTGFVVAATKEGKPIKSKQIDILIWDSTNYAPIFRDKDFVIVPPEACKAIIEVKGKLTSEEFKNSLKLTDSFIDFISTEYLSHQFKINKYIFAYEIDKNLKFPISLFEIINKFYTDNNKISLEDRMYCTARDFPSSHLGYLFSVDGIFILSHGAIIRDIIGYIDSSARLLFKAYDTCTPDGDHTYSYFEYNLQSSIGSELGQGLWYYEQPGLLSVTKNISVKKNSTAHLMIFPQIPEENYYGWINPKTVYKCKKLKISKK